MDTRRWLIVYALLIICIGLGTTPALASTPVYTTGNNFTMIQPDGVAFGGTNDVQFTWDGTQKTSVAVSGQVSNATISSSCPFFGQTWYTHDIAIYGPGTYTVYQLCPAGSPGCGLWDAGSPPVIFTVNGGEIGGHILLDWNGITNQDIVNVWQPKAVFGPSAIWTGACGANPADKVWDWMSRDVNGDGINGYPMITSEPSSPGMQPNFNLMGTTDLCDGVVCPTVMVCDSPLACDPATGQCVPLNPSCSDGNNCTNDSCDVSAGQCVHSPVVCNDGNACTFDTCHWDAVGVCIYEPVADGTTCLVEGQPGTCTAGACNPSPVCPAGMVKTVTSRGGGQNPGTVDLQIQTQFTAVNDGCIAGAGASGITCTPGTVLLVDVMAGNGPMPTNCTWKGVALESNSAFTVVCPDVSGDVGKLICDNKDNGGKDVDRISIKVQ